MQRLALLFALMLLSPALAFGQSGELGPGPFTSIVFKPKAITFTVDKGASDSVVFAGSPQISVVVNGAEVAFSQPAVIKKAGAKLKQAGTAGGQSMSALFPEGQARVMKLRNGNGATTELGVERRGAALAVTSIVRGSGGGPGGGGGVILTGTADVSGAASSSTDVVLRPAAGSGLDVTIEATVPAAPAGASSFSAAIVATSGGQEVARSAWHEVSGGHADFALRLPAASYALVVEYQAVVGTLQTSELTATRRVDLGRTIAVAASAREFEVALPAMPMPSLQPSTVNVANAGQFDPPAGGANAVLVTIGTASTSGLEQYTIAAMRELSGSGSVSVAISAPSGSYVGSVSVMPSIAATGGQVAANYHVATYAVQSAVLPGTISASFPAATRVASSLRDPNGVLPAGDLANPGRVAHLVVLSGILGSGATVVTSTAVVLDATQDFTLYYPTGAIGTVIPVLDLSNAAPDGQALENVTLSYNPGLFFFAAPARIDVVAPAIRRITVAGRTVDASSAPVASASTSAFSATVEGLAGAAVNGLFVTGSDGRFSLEVPAATTYTITATSAAGASRATFAEAVERILRAGGGR